MSNHQQLCQPAAPILVLATPREAALIYLAEWRAVTAHLLAMTKACTPAEQHALWLELATDTEALMGELETMDDVWRAAQRPQDLWTDIEF